MYYNKWWIDHTMTRPIIRNAFLHKAISHEDINYTYKFNELSFSSIKFHFLFI